MLIILLAYLGGVLTIVSPCILPVLPFVFARADQALREALYRCWRAWPAPSPSSRRSPRWAAGGRFVPTR